LSNISFEFEFNYNITSAPELINEVGIGRVVLTNFNISAAARPMIVVNPETGRNEYEVQISNIYLNAENITASL